MGDNQFGAIYQDYAWETSGTIAHSWGYNALENQWKSTSQLLQSLIDNVSLNGGFTLNIGPRADGSVPYEGIRRLEDIGNWLSKNGQIDLWQYRIDIASRSERLGPHHQQEDQYNKTGRLPADLQLAA